MSILGDRWDRFGIDASEYAIGEARRRTPDAKFAVAGAGDFPFRRQFDVITAFDVLEHIPDLETVLFRVSQSLAPGGAFIFVVPVYDGPTGPIIRALDQDPTHVHKQSRDFWLSCVSERFCLIDWRGIYRYLVGGRVLRSCCNPGIAEVYSGDRVLHPASQSGAVARLDLEARSEDGPKNMIAFSQNIRKMGEVIVFRAHGLAEFGTLT